MNIKSICDILVNGHADIAGHTVSSTDELQVLAATTSPSISAIVDDGEILQNVYRDDVKAIRKCLEAIADGDGSQRTTVRVGVSSDEWCFVEFTIYPPGKFGDESVSIFTGRNVTDQHFFNQRREVINRVLRHNLRNDMSTIIGYAQLAREQCDCESGSLLTKIETNAQSLFSLSENIRDINNRLNDSNYRFRRVKLRTIIENAVETYHAEYPETRFSVNVSDHVIAGSSLVGDAIEEVIENAIKHGGKSTEDLTISIATNENSDTDEIELLITDNGEGIPAGEVEPISEMTESQLKHGSSVGLWLVKWIADSVFATFEIRQRESQQGTAVVFGFMDADRMDEADEQELTELNQRKIIRSKLLDSGLSDIGTSTRG